MASYFFDTSALAKRYVEEIGSDVVRSILEDVANHLVFIADITEVEIASALFRRSKNGSLSSEGARAAFLDFERDKAAQYFVLNFDTYQVTAARRLVERYLLRAYDAVQLSSAIECMAEQTRLNLPPIEFVSSDSELLQAASEEGFPILNPNTFQSNDTGKEDN